MHYDVRRMLDARAQMSRRRPRPAECRADRGTFPRQIRREISMDVLAGRGATAVGR